MEDQISNFIRRGSDSIKWDSADAEVLPMWVADMDFPADEGIIQALRARLDHGYFGYSKAPSDYEQVFIDWVRSRQGWNLCHEWLVYGPSVMIALRAAVDVLCPVDGAVALPRPVYPPFFSSVRDQGRTLYEVDTPFNQSSGRFEFDFSALEDVLSRRETAMLLLCNPHNPLGRVWEQDEIRRIAQLCVKHSVLVISDEIHADFRYDGRNFAPILPELIALGRPELGVSIQAPSKTFNIPGLLSAHVIIPDSELRIRFETAMAARGLDHPNLMACIASREAYAQGGPWLDKTMAQLEANRQQVGSFLHDHASLFSDGPFEVCQAHPEGTYLYWIDGRNIAHRKGLDGQKAFHSLKRDARLWLSPGWTFSDESAEFFRLNFGCPPFILEEGLSRFLSWLQ